VSDLQALQRLRSKILQVDATLGSCLSLAVDMKNHIILHGESTDQQRTKTIYDIAKSIDTYAAKVRLYQHATAVLVQSLSGTLDLVCTVCFLISDIFLY
jgi:predicted urease superfamily metal-dependent hydrolase